MKKVLYLPLFLLTLYGWTGCKDEYEKTPVTTIGFSTPNLPDSYSATIYNAAFQEALQNECSVIFTNAEGKTGNQQGQIESMKNLNFDAIIISPYQIDSLTQQIEEARKNNIPVVFINTDHTENADACVLTDYTSAAQQAAQYLKETKSSGTNYSVFYTVGSVNEETLELLTGGITETLEPALYKPDLSNGKARACTNENAARTMARLLIKKAAPNNVEAFIAYDDGAAKGILAAIKEAGKTIEEITLISISGSPDSKRGIKNGELNATIAQSPVQLGAEAIKTAIKLIKKQPVDTRTVIPTRLIHSGNIDQFDTDNWQ